MITIYYAFVYSTVVQNIIIWGGISDSKIKLIEVTLNKILRIILNVRLNENRIPSMPTNFMYKSLNLLKFKDVYKYFLLKFFHYALFRNSNIFEVYYQHLVSNHRYHTRNNIINLPYVRLNIQKHFTIFQSCKLANELPGIFLEPQSDGQLKSRFKKFSIAQY